MKEFTVRVPGTSANIGPGFDCLGIAFQIYNWFTFTWENPTETITPLAQEEYLATTSRAQLPMVEAYVMFCKLFDLELPMLSNVQSVKSNVPVARGLGSSATCYVAGARAAQYLAKDFYSATEIMNYIKEYEIDPFSKDAVLAVASAIEKHPDNLSPAVFGGLQIASILKDNGLPQVLNQSLSIHEDIKFIVAYPDFTLKTTNARAVLPSKIKREDAIFNMRALTFLLEGIKNADQRLLENGLRDRLHQPYRAELIPGFFEILEIGKKYGAAGSVLSGAGPAILTVLIEKNSNSESIRKKIQESLGNSWTVINLEVDQKGFTSQIDKAF